jgi:hypothetical protein
VGGTCNMHLEMRNAHTIWDAKPGEKRPLGRTTCRWADNIKMYIRETGWGCGLDLWRTQPV